MRVDRSLLESLGIGSTPIDRFLPALRRALPPESIDTPLRIAHFLAQVAHESAGLRRVRENLSYSESALRDTFPGHFTPAEARAFARQPERIANRVYANRNGNGNEASGDGFRYRGRGLIQLTGKRNYAAFAAFVDSDVVADPDLVATDFPVESAVFYWSDRDINRLADLDDARAVTRAVNGGLNGLAERLLLLQRAKGHLEVEGAVPIDASEFTHRVSATALNLRRRPVVTPATRIATLPQGTPVRILASSDVEGWVEVRTVVDGRPAEGFVSRRFLERSPDESLPEPVAATLPAVHLAEDRRDVTRARDGGRAFPLGEAGRPRRRGTRPETRVDSLVEIVEYLGVDRPGHLRYGPTQTATFCNIYAYDYVYLAGAYLPRVWWTSEALLQIGAGETPPVHYGATVSELNANMLHDWLQAHGDGFGWQRAVDLDVLQAAANGGQVALVVARRADRNRAGHIAAVVPEHGSLQAERSSAGAVVRPLTSQAGSRNFRFEPASPWWRATKFDSFGFWHHA